MQPHCAKFLRARAEIASLKDIQVTNLCLYVLYISPAHAKLTFLENDPCGGNQLHSQVFVRFPQLGV